MLRAQRLSEAHLYLVTDVAPGGRPLADVVAAALRGGVDVVQLRDKQADDDTLLQAAVATRAACHAAGALFIVNDRPDLALASGADGVHVGQDDLGVSQARAIVGPDAIIGLSTHTPEQVDVAHDEASGWPDYIGVGPIHATPTKPGRAAVGLDLVGYAARTAAIPWFAIGGVDGHTLPAVIDAGATRAAVVRAITAAPDPEDVARALRAALTRTRPLPTEVPHG